MTPDPLFELLCRTLKSLLPVNDCESSLELYHSIIDINY